MMLTPSLVFLDRGSVWVEATDIENWTVSDQWYKVQWRHRAFFLLLF